MPPWLKSPWLPAMAALGIALVALGIVIGRGSDSATQARTEGPPPAVATATDARLAAAEQQLARLQAGAPGRPPAGPPPSPMQMQADRARANHASAQEHEALRRQLDAEFATLSGRGAADSKVSLNLSQQMGNEALMGATDPPLRDDIVCRGQLCRMEFVFADPVAAENWSNFYPVTVAERLEKVDMFSEAGSDGSTTLLMYGVVRKP